MQKDQYKHLTVLIASIILVIMQLIMFSIMLYYPYGRYADWPFIRKQTLANIIIYAIFLISFTRVTGGYRVGYLRIREVCIAQAVGIVSANFIEYFELCLFYGRFVIVWPLVCLTVISILMATIWAYIVRRTYLAMYPAHRMLLIYADRIQNELINKFSKREDKFLIEETYCIKGKDYDEIIAHISNYSSIVLADIPTEFRNDILKFCYGKGIRTYTTPKISDILLGGEEKIHLFDTPLLLGRNYGLTIEQIIVKRILDIVLSGIFLVISAPLFIVIAILIKFNDGGSVFFLQERLTCNSKRFSIYKFKTMKDYRGVDEERVTKMGAFLRRTHLDELPQLINVFKGDMSLVGPRPLVPRDYDNAIPEFIFRLKVKAGMTGYAQVYGSHVTSEYDKLKLDLFYISNYSILMDIKLLLMTIRPIIQMDKRETMENSKPE